jgi:hypothetical protein
MIMKLFILLLLFSIPVFAGTKVDNDGDGLFCVMEDDGLYCGEDDQDICDFIPNVSRDDGHCSVDRNDDGLFTLADVNIMLDQYDHRLGGGFGGFVCYDIMKVITYNRRLSLAGLLPLQMNLPFIVLSAGSHCSGHHIYPPID